MQAISNQKTKKNAKTELKGNTEKIRTFFTTKTLIGLISESSKIVNIITLKKLKLKMEI